MAYRDFPLHRDFVDSTDQDLINNLQKLGIEYTKDRFKQLVTKYPIDLDKMVKDEFISSIKVNSTSEREEENNVSTVYYSILELSMRDFPTIPTCYRLNYLMQNGYTEFYKFSNLRKEVESWIKCWKLIKQLIPADVSSVEEADSLLYPLDQSIFNWCQDFSHKLDQLAMKDQQFLDLHISYLEEFIDKFPDSYKPMLSGLKLTLIEQYIFNKGDIHKGNKLANELIKTSPDEPEIYLRFFDFIKSFCRKNNRQLPLSKMRKILRVGLSKALKAKSQFNYDNYDLIERMKSELDELERSV